MSARPTTPAVPAHDHGGPSAVYAYNRGCRHPECRAKASEAKAKLRERYVAKRIRIQYVTADDKVEMRWISPALAPAHHTHIKARHGTEIGRREYRCDCDPCRAARRTTNPEEEGTQ